jgi:dihydrofolate reductase
MLIAGMTTSLDGFVEDGDGSTARLSTDFDSLRESPFMRAIIERTGAVLMGRRTFGMADPDSYLGTYELQVPIFVVTHRPPPVPPAQDDRLTFTFVTDGVESAVAQATAAAGDKDVLVVGGADLIGQLLRAGLADELHLDLMPVFLGTGRRLFDDPDLARVRLEKLAVEEVGTRTSLRFRVVR